MSSIPQIEPDIRDGDAEAVARYMRSGGWLTEFEHTRRFERLIAQAAGTQFCSAAPNGTLAIFLALVACGVQRDDEVVVPDLTMAASATAVILAGARPVFVDIDPVTLCLDLTRAQDAFSPRTTAVVFVSLNGRAPAELPEFVAACRTKRIRVIEDAAQSFGSSLQGTPLGSIGDCGCFSFSPHKIVTTGQGGAVVTSDPGIESRVRLMRDFGRRQGGTDHYETVGWNFKFTDLQAVLGIEQLNRLPTLIRRKREIFARYSEALSGIAGVECPRTDLTHTTPWFVDVLTASDTRTALAEFLLLHGVGTRPFYPALHSEPAFSARGDFPVAVDISKRGIWLPSSLRLTDADIDRVCRLIRTFFGA